MQTPSEPRPGRIFFALVAVLMILVAVGVAVELAPVVGGHPQQPLLFSSATAASGQVVIPSGIGSNPDLNYVPNVVTVIIGYNNTVVFLNNDHTAPEHTVTSTLASNATGYFNSGNILAGQSWSHTFSTPGTFDFYCIYHSWMKGEIIVLQSFPNGST